MRETERVAAAAVTAGLHVREHWEIIPRAGKPPLVAVDVLGTAATTATARHTLTVRDHAGEWTPDLLRVRADLGMPPRPR
jgi:hypothetical protein